MSLVAIERERHFALLRQLAYDLAVCARRLEELSGKSSSVPEDLLQALKQELVFGPENCIPSDSHIDRQRDDEQGSHRSVN
jgi:hypothetical protein